MEKFGKGKRTQDFLKMKSSMVLKADDEHRQKFIEIARNETPTQAYEIAKFYADKAEDIFPQAEEYAKSCRFLAILKRDYGKESFDEVIV